ncbi:hypothetical protein IJE86_03415 [bacterium]|nr:hypothetical protein [bacterium]
MIDKNQLKQDLLNMIQQTIDKTAKKLANELANRLASRPESEYYIRTGDLVEALSNPPKAYYSGDEIIWSLIDESKIRQKVTQIGMFNQHMSLGGETNYDSLSIKYHALINQNYGYGLPNGGRIPGLNYIRGALGTNDIEYYLNNEIQKLVRKYGENLMKGVK